MHPQATRSWCPAGTDARLDQHLAAVNLAAAAAVATAAVVVVAAAAVAAVAAAVAAVVAALMVGMLLLLLLLLLLAVFVPAECRPACSPCWLDVRQLLLLVAALATLE